MNVNRPWREKSRLEILNRIVCQWFFFRICRILEWECCPWSQKQTGWAIQFPVCPLTGWEWPIDYVWRPRTFIVWNFCR